MEKSTVKIPGHEKRNSHFAKSVNDSQDAFAGVSPIHRDLYWEQLWECDSGIRGIVKKSLDGHIGGTKMGDLILVIPT